MVCSAIFEVHEYRKCTILEKGKGTHHRQKQTRKLIRALEVKERSLEKKAIFIQEERSELALEHGIIA